MADIEEGFSEIGKRLKELGKCYLYRFKCAMGLCILHTLNFAEESRVLILLMEQTTNIMINYRNICPEEPKVLKIFFFTNWMLFTPPGIILSPPKIITGFVKKQLTL